jgi:nitroreductase
MSFSKLAWKRKSIRNFKPDDVPVEMIIKLLDAARSAPSGGNCQPWHFYVIKETALKKQIHETTGGRQAFILDAPVIIVVCADLERTSSRYGDRGRNLYSVQDTAAAIQNLLLCAVDERLAACWCGAFDEKAVSDILKLNDGLRPVAIIPIGYAVNEPAKTSRRSIEEISTFIGFEDESLPKNEPQRVKFEHADLGGALFNDLNLANSEFVNINMRGCSFSDVSLAGGKITGCDLSCMEISSCILDGFTVNGKAVSDLIKGELAK